MEDPGERGQVDGVLLADEVGFAPYPPQAKGFLAGRLGLSVSDVFSLLRQQARSRNRRL